MQIMTKEEARQAFSVLLCGAKESVDLLRALEQADARVVIDAAAALLVAEAAVVLGEKGWTVPDVQRAASKMGTIGPSRVAIEAALADPDELPTRLRAGWQEPLGLIRDVLRMLRFLRLLPRLPPAHLPRRTDNDEQTRLHAKVRALLAKAESTPFEAEAAAFTAKAQELMARYAIDDAMLQAGNATPGAATSMRVVVETPYAKPKVILLSVIARNNRSHSVWSEVFGFATVFGAPGDLWAVDLLYTSLLVQAAAAIQREAERSRSFRHAFLLGFARRIDERLRQGTATATAAATVESGDAFLPVLARREDAAVAAPDAAFPRRTALRVSMSNYSGAQAGRAAADAASITRDTPIANRNRRLDRPRP